MAGASGSSTLLAPKGNVTRGCAALLLVGGLLLPAPLATASEVSPLPECVPTTVTLPATGDAWVADFLSSPTGSDGVLMVQATPSGSARALVSFTLPAAPAGCAVESARLRLHTPLGSDGAQLEATAVASTWSENTVTWATQPATTGATASAWSMDGYVRWTVTDLVEGVTGPIGFQIRDEDDGTPDGHQHVFHAKEKREHPPQLVVRYAAPVDDDDQAPPPAEPVPTVVRCGQELTASTLVTNNLGNCQGNGLVVGAPNIIIDLGGRTIDGTGLEAGVLNDGYEGVVVRNGTIADFDHGVQLLAESDESVVEGVTFRLNQLSAVEVFDTDGAIVRNNTLVRNFGGIHLLNGSSDGLVSGNTITDSADTALYVRDSDANTLADNTVVRGGGLGVGLERSDGNLVANNHISGTSDNGIEVADDSDDNRIEGNWVDDAGDTGIMVAGSARNHVIGNTAQHMSDSGIGLNDADESVVTGNTVRFNSDGMQVDANRSTISGNIATANTGAGLEFGSDAVANLVVSNTASSNAKEGIVLSGQAPAGEANVLERNQVHANGGDGIFAALGGHLLRGNVANGNRVWGISAVGSIDGGDNLATGNGMARQCEGVPCNRDTIPPETTIDSAPEDASTTETGATFGFNADEPVARFECALDAAPFSPCASPKAYAGLAVGDHTFRVRAVDVAGNIDPTPAVHEWTIVAVHPDPTPDPTPEPTTPPAPTCAVATLTVNASADSWLDQKDATKNFGTDSNLKLRSKGTGENLRTVVGFTLPILPDGCAVQSATLRMYDGSAKTGRTLLAQRLASPWAERTVTWANQPATIGAGATAAARSGWVEWAVAEDVAAMYATGASHGFVLRDAVEGQDAEQTFHSREKGQNVPQLRVTVGPR